MKSLVIVIPILFFDFSMIAMASWYLLLLIALIILVFVAL